MSERNIYQRMSAVMKAVRGVAKTERNPHGGYSYAGHEKVTEALRDKYVEHGIVRTADVTETVRDGGTLRLTVLVSWVNVDKPEDKCSVHAVGESPDVTKSGKPSAVQAGIALSYAVKNAEFKAFSLTGDDTPDSEDRDDRGSAEVADFVFRYSECADMAAIEALNQEVRAVWKSVSGEQSKLFAARGEAMKRVSGK